MCSFPEQQCLRNELNKAFPDNDLTGRKFPFLTWLNSNSSGLAMCASRTSFEGQVNTSDLGFFGIGSQVDCDLAFLAGETSTGACCVGEMVAGGTLLTSSVPSVNLIGVLFDAASSSFSVISGSAVKSVSW
jgi:hypothetical protein